MREFRRAIEVRDIDRLMPLLAEDIVFRSPVVYSPYQGRTQVAEFLRAAVEVFEDVTYTRELRTVDASEHAFVFQARVGAREVEGCDFVHTNGEGLIDELYVMVRPLSAALAVSDAIKRQLARVSDPAASAGASG